MVTENMDANALYRQNKVETEQLSCSLRNFIYLRQDQKMSMRKISTCTSLNIAANAETAGTQITQFRNTKFNGLINLCWTVPGSKPSGGEIIRIRPERPWGPTSLPYNEYWVSFAGGKATGAWR
jgi:hypothetical protein